MNIYVCACFPLTGSPYAIWAGLELAIQPRLILDLGSSCFFHQVLGLLAGMYHHAQLQILICKCFTSVSI